MTVESEIADEERTLARARVTVVFFDQATQRSVAPDARAAGGARAVRVGATRSC